MKFSLLSLIFTSVIMTQTTAQDINLSSIESTINLYFDGMVNHNSASIKKAFSPTASMKWVEKGEYQEVNAADALTEYLDSNKPSKSCSSPKKLDRHLSLIKLYNFNKWQVEKSTVQNSRRVSS